MLDFPNRCRLHVRHCDARSEEHTSELQSQSTLVCRLLLEKKNASTSSGCRAVASAMCTDSFWIAASRRWTGELSSLSIQHLVPMFANMALAVAQPHSRSAH